jgi:cardiolipin synthase
LHPFAFALNLSLPMTTANKITILRILLIPFFVVELIYYVRTGNEAHRLAAILCFAVAAICDGVDGYIARRYHQISELGKILDPLADKLLLVSGVVLLSFDNAPYFGQIPLWFTGTIIGRDLLLAIGAVVIRLVVGEITVRPRFLGKCATVLQMMVVIGVLMRWDLGAGGRWYFAGAAAGAVCTGLSGLWYVFDGIKQLGAHPASSAKTKPADGGA